MCQQHWAECCLSAVTLDCAIVSVHFTDADTKPQRSKGTRPGSPPSSQSWSRSACLTPGLRPPASPPLQPAAVPRPHPPKYETNLQTKCLVPLARGTGLELLVHSKCSAGLHNRHPVGVGSPPPPANISRERLKPHVWRPYADRIAGRTFRMNSRRRGLSLGLTFGARPRLQPPKPASASPSPTQTLTH